MYMSTILEKPPIPPKDQNNEKTNSRKELQPEQTPETFYGNRFISEAVTPEKAQEVDERRQALNKMWINLTEKQTDKLFDEAVDANSLSKEEHYALSQLLDANEKQKNPVEAKVQEAVAEAAQEENTEGERFLHGLQRLGDRIMQYFAPRGGEEEWRNLQTSDKTYARYGEMINLAAQAGLVKVTIERNDPSLDTQQQSLIELRDRFKRFQNNPDIPDTFKKENVLLAITLIDDRFPTTAVGERKTIEAVKETAEQLPSSTVVQSRPALENTPVEQKPALQPEKVFGRDAMTLEDTRAISGEINTLFKENTPESAIQAARELVHLKRAKIKVTEKHQEKVFNQLLSQREAVVNNEAIDVMDKARYLTYLKDLGAIKGVNEKEQKVLRDGINKRIKSYSEPSAGGEKKQDLSQLLVYDKYLTGKKDYSAFEPQIAQEIEFVNKDGGESRVAYRLARAKYLGIQSNRLGEYEKQTAGTIDSKLAEFRSKGAWNRFAKLQEVVNIQRGDKGEKNLNNDAQEKLVEHVNTIRKDSKKAENWDQFVSYVGSITRLSEQLRNKRKPVEAAAGSTVPLEEATPAGSEKRTTVHTEKKTGEIPAGGEKPQVAEAEVLEKLAEIFNRLAGEKHEKNKDETPEWISRLLHRLQEVIEQERRRRETAKQAAKIPTVTLATAEDIAANLGQMDEGKLDTYYENRLTQHEKVRESVSPAELEIGIEDYLNGRYLDEDYEKTITKVAVGPEQESIVGKKGIWAKRFVGSLDSQLDYNKKSWFGKLRARYKVFGVRALFQWRKSKERLIGLRDTTAENLRTTALREDKGTSGSERIVFSRLANEIDEVNQSNIRENA